jgi:hypothetical protein
MHGRKTQDFQIHKDVEKEEKRERKGMHRAAIRQKIQMYH